MHQLEKTITSLEVAEMVGREHKEVLRNIRNILTQIGESKNALSYFIESNYESSQNKTLPCYRLTKKGCELFATRMTGEKGTQFAMAYIERFNEMENALAKPSNTKLLLKTALEHEERIDNIQSDVNYLKNTMRIDGNQEHVIRKRANAVVVESLEGKNSPAYKGMAFKVFSAFWRDFKNHFEIPRYGELPKKKYEEGLRFIGMWQPSTSLKIEIDNANRQQTIGVI